MFQAFVASHAYVHQVSFVSHADARQVTFTSQVCVLISHEDALLFHAHAF